MRRNTILLFLLMMTVWSFAEEVKIIRVMTDGTEVTEYYSADIESLVIFDSDGNGYRTQDIRGLEKLKHLKVLEFQNLAFLKNYNFLKKISTLEELYFDAVYFSDFSVLSDMTKLKKVEHNGYMPKETIEKIRSEGLDFSFCPDLELFVLDPLKERFDFIPDIRVSSKKVWLRMYNQPITRDKLSKQEQKILKRFDPDTASLVTWELLGFSVKQAQTIIRYRTKIGGFQYKERLANCFVIGEKGYERLEPYIALPSMYDKKRVTVVAHSSKELFLFNPDTASVTTFQTLGFSARQAKVLIHFREALGGRFGSIEQFGKSYVVDSVTLERLRPYMVFE